MYDYGALTLIVAVIVGVSGLIIAYKRYGVAKRRLVSRGGTFDLTVPARETLRLFQIKGKGKFGSLEFSTTYKYHSKVELSFVLDGDSLPTFTMEELRNSEWWKPKFSTSDSTYDFQRSYDYSFSREIYLQLINPEPTIIEIKGKYTYSVYE